MAAVEVIVLSEAEVLQHLSFKLAYSAVREALIAAADGTGAINPVVIGRGLNEGEVFSIKSGASARGRVVGLKVGSYWPQNRRGGFPPHGSAILLLDPENGRLMAVVEGSRLNGPRTAAADAVAAHVLARPESSTLAVIGAGHQGEQEVRALCQILPIRQVLLADRDEARAAQLAEILSKDVKAAVNVVNVERACRAADVLVTVTPSCEPLFEADWLKPGTHVAGMGCDQAGKQEMPPALLRRARLFCDLPSQSLAVGELQHVRAEIETGVLTVAAIGAVLTGAAPGRSHSDEITVFDSSGLALQDLFVATDVLRAAALR